ncbi:MAG: hypothetical protein OXR66_03550 [Candidatus Woesearchaeota archaeon]|nr:hypothetical protein [Candidatus Woesearchaeota archaeon]
MSVIDKRGFWGFLQMIFWLFYNMNQWAMAVYWVLYLRFIYTGGLEYFAHAMGIISFLYLISQLIYFTSKHVD